MGETVVVRQAGPVDIAAATEIWHASHLARRNGRPLPVERRGLVRERMAASDACLLVAEDVRECAEFPQRGDLRRCGDLRQSDAVAPCGVASDASVSRPGPGAGPAPDLHPDPGPDGDRAVGSPAPPVLGCILGVPGREADGDGPPVPGLLHICLVSVLPDRWGEHVGRLLVDAMLARAAGDGYQHAQLWTHADNTRSNRLYRATGFRRTGRARIDDWGELVVHYRRDLKDLLPGKDRVAAADQSP